jgi:hypothetical protein
VYGAIQCELHERELGSPYASHVYGARRAFTAYLQTEGALETRLAAGVRSGWESRMRHDRENEFWAIVDRCIEQYFDAED